MSKFDILEQFSNEELKQILKRRGEHVQDTFMIDSVAAASGHAYNQDSANFSFYFHNTGNKPLNIKLETRTVKK